MKKTLIKIMGIILILILDYQQFSYADVVVIEPIDVFRPISVLIAFIGVIVLIVTAISFFALKSAIKKGEDSEITGLNDEEIKKKRNNIQRNVYFCVMVLSIVGIINLGLDGNVSIIVFAIPTILFVISLIFRLCKNKKISNIICGLSVLCICIIAVWIETKNIDIENYNNQFLQYEKSNGGPLSAINSICISDVKGLLNMAINNNRNDRKVTIIYKDISYTSEDELKKLLDYIELDNVYSMNVYYDKQNNKDKYIKSIEIAEYYGQFRELVRFQGKQKRGGVVRTLISSIPMTVSSHPESTITISYINKPNQTKTINIDKNFNQDNVQELRKLSEEISTDKKYDIKMQIDTNICNIMITENN